jgi:tetrahydromethanopterin S-methyltransferase subunit G
MQLKDEDLFRNEKKLTVKIKLSELKKRLKQIIRRLDNTPGTLPERIKHRLQDLEQKIK